MTRNYMVFAVFADSGFQRGNYQSITILVYVYRRNCSAQTFLCSQGGRVPFGQWLTPFGLLCKQSKMVNFHKSPYLGIRLSY